jgi:trimeric autotransporter adhesin
MQSRPSRQPRQSRSQPRSQPRSWLTVCLSVGVASACGTDLDPPAQTDGQVDVAPTGASVPGAPVDAPIRPLAQRAYVKAGNTGAYDYFGSSVALSADGLTLAVGALGEDSGARGANGADADESIPQSGAVYVYRRRGQTWIQQAYLKASNPGAEDFFGTSVALSADGSTLAVAAPREASAATGVDGDQTDDSAPGAGAVYVFTRRGQTWTQQAYLKASNTDVDDNFGFDLALSADGSTLAVGVPWEDSEATGIGGDQADDSAESSGAVYVFTRTGVTWRQQAYIKAPNTEAYDLFGYTVALSGDGATLAVSATAEDSAAIGGHGDPSDESATDAGAVYVLARTSAVWSHQAYLKAENAETLDYFGYSLALSDNGSTLAVGVPNESSGLTSAGADPADNSASHAGAVYVLTRSGQTWTQQAYLKAKNAEAGDVFGYTVALSGDGSILAASAFLEDSAARGVGDDPADNSAQSAGAAYVLARSGSAWSQTDYVKASNPGAGDLFGASLALSADGVTLAVGATQESSAATGIDGDQSDASATFAGAVYVLDRRR